MTEYENRDKLTELLWSGLEAAPDDAETVEVPTAALVAVLNLLDSAAWPGPNNDVIEAPQNHVVFSFLASGNPELAAMEHMWETVTGVSRNEAPALAGHYMLDVPAQRRVITWLVDRHRSEHPEGNDQ